MEKTKVLIDRFTDLKSEAYYISSKCKDRSINYRIDLYIAFPKMSEVLHN